MERKRRVLPQHLLNFRALRLKLSLPVSHPASRRRTQLLSPLWGGRACPERPNASSCAALEAVARGRGVCGAHRGGNNGRGGSGGASFPAGGGDALAGGNRRRGRHASARGGCLDRAARAEPDAGSGSLSFFDTLPVPDTHTLADADGSADGNANHDADRAAAARAPTSSAAITATTATGPNAVVDPHAVLPPGPEPTPPAGQ